MGENYNVLATAVANGNTETVTVTEDTTRITTEPTLNLRLRRPQVSREVHWAEGTVDNEGMDKKKSKCCCIYEKPRTFDESSSESDDECEHCRGHVEKKKTKRPKLEDSAPADPAPVLDDPPNPPPTL